MKGTYEKTVEEHPLSFGGVELPVRLYCANFDETVPVEMDFSDEALLEQAREQIDQMVSEQFAQVEILSKEESISSNSDKLTLTVQFVCKENIAIEDEILIFP